MTVSTRTRFEVFQRDRFACQYCGRTPPDVLLHVDHIVPKKEGGGDEIENLRTACRDCNLGKGAQPLRAGSMRPSISTEELQERIEQAEAYGQLLAASRTARERLDGQLHDLVLLAWVKAWDGGLVEKSDGSYFEMPNGGYVPDWRSVKNILRRLPIERVYDAIDITAGRFPRKASFDSTRYFYGVCWRMIREGES
jgi:hypothetical protein